MKIGYRDIESFVKAPNKAARVILVYGPDSGLMKERAKTMGLSVVPDINDPFNAVTLSTDILLDDPARLSDEAGALSMMGGDRLIRVEDAGDKITPLIKDYLQNPNENALIILEAGELGPRSSLRKLCEAEKNAAALPCYVEDERDLGRLIRQSMQDANLMIDNDAVSWLAVNISGNRQKVRSELDKVITYKGAEGGKVTLEDVRACCGEAGAIALDDLVYSAAGNQPEKALRTYAQLMEEGVNFIVVVRALQNHFRKLHLTRAKIDGGMSVDEAVKGLQPPLFFKQAPIFKAQAGRWRLATLDKVLGRLMDLEAQCKTTNMPVETLCAQAVLSISSVRN
ncbi:MAG: DNA polymerase III subunit delta [Alphaproteobacteria bacterium]|nr:DNA polymerase III subunit delta [Alphaproteobacteria bacterium]